MQRIRRSAAKRNKVQLNQNMKREYGKRAKPVVPKKSRAKPALQTDDDDAQVSDYEIATVDVPMDADVNDEDKEQGTVEGDDGQNEEEQAEGEGDDGQNIEEEQGEGEADDGHEMVDVELLLDQGATSDQEEQGSATD